MPNYKNSETDRIKITGGSVGLDGRGSTVMISTKDPAEKVYFPDPSPPPPYEESSQLLPVTDDLTLHLRSDKQILYSSGQNVRVWKDLSGRENNFFMGTGSRQPEVSSSVKAEKQVIYFDESSDNYLTAYPVHTASEPGEIFVVLRNIDSASDQQLMHFNSNANSNVYPSSADTILDGFGSTNRFSWTPTANNVDLLNQWHILNISSISGEYIGRITGSQIYTNGSNTIGWQTGYWNIGAYLGVNPTATYSGYIAEVVLYSRKLTSEERSSVFSYLQTTWELNNTHTSSFFSSGSDYLYINDPTSLSSEGEMTCEGYFNFKEFNQENILVAKTISGSENAYSFYYDNINSNIVFEHKNFLGDYALFVSGGINDHVFHNINSNLDQTSGEFSLECHVKFSDISTNESGTFMAKYDYEYDQLHYWFYYDSVNNNLVCKWHTGLGGGGGANILNATASFAPDLNRWYHLAFTNEDISVGGQESEGTLYVDGDIVMQATFTDGADLPRFGNHARFTVGGIESGSVGHAHSGSIKNVRVWLGDVRTQSEIRTYMTSSLNAKDFAEANNLAGFYEFENSLEDSADVTTGYDLQNAGGAVFVGNHFKTTASFSPSVDTWYHLAATQKQDAQNSFTAILQDGVPLVIHTASFGGGVVSGSISVSGSNTINFTLGNIESGSLTTAFSGAIDDVRYWNDIRSPAEVSSSLSSAYTSTGNNLSGNYRFEGNLNDSSGFDNNLVANNTICYTGSVPYQIVNRMNDDGA